ncbi:hypothetical protein HYH02_014963 [Chlamydomonas schloesseri]|uniref:Uncharacterized protein n=1 Tax=Chlamydomonas schloesseri TaxID=2026947 RepID=A0A835SIV0_9CHLO|nr:hypothetical protein HYH02_014963 [Chlamydomonas schloesseri]|eukprot:KAG2425747.1 hypothetical protein HYH02_014963 [Chlamydomonas schloesseri]
MVAGSPTVVTQGTTTPLYVNNVLEGSMYFAWYPITLASNTDKWGGYFTVPVPRAGQTFSTLAPSPPDLVSAAGGLFMCAGCADNNANKGYFFGGVTLSVERTSAGLKATCSIALPPAGSSTSKGVVLSSAVEELHLYASYDILATGAPGQWPKPDSITPAVGSVGPGSILTATETVGGTPSGVIYLACHLKTTTCFAPSSYGY